MRQKKQVSQGFTLIELMIVAAIIAIIAAIALPAFTEQVARGRRADAQGVLLESGQWLERYYSTNNNYDAATAFAGSGLLYSPKGSTASNANYAITLTVSASFQTYSLTATRANAQANDSCGDYRLNSVGQRTLVNTTRTDCWSK